MEPAKSFTEFFLDKDFSLPLWEVTILIVIVSTCLLAGKHKTGLLIAYFFLFYWTFIFNRVHIMELLGNTNWGAYAFGTLGVIVAIIIVIGFFIEGDD
jgi:hypothetical protein